VNAIFDTEIDKTQSNSNGQFYLNKVRKSAWEDRISFTWSPNKCFWSL